MASCLFTNQSAVRTLPAALFYLEVNTMPDGGFDDDNDGGVQWFATVGHEQQQQQQQPAVEAAESE